jgi:hypothetical protein
MSFPWTMIPMKQADAVPPRGFEPPLHGFSNHRLYLLVYGGMIDHVRVLGLEPSCPEGGCFTGNLGSLTVNTPATVHLE